MIIGQSIYKRTKSLPQNQIIQCAPISFAFWWCKLFWHFKLRLFEPTEFKVWDI